VKQRLVFDALIEREEAERVAPFGHVDFFLDAGCFNDLRRRQRSVLGRGITACAAPDATLLVLALAPGRRGPLPRGASRPTSPTPFPGPVSVGTGVEGPALLSVEGNAANAADVTTRPQNPRWRRRR
jgi:hypothetical protein